MRIFDLFLIVFAPGLINQVFNFGSLSHGVIITLLFIALTSPLLWIEKAPSRSLFLSLLLLLIIAVFFIILPSCIFNEFNHFRAYSSVVYLFIFFLVSWIFASRLTEQDSGCLNRTVITIFYSLMIVYVVAVAAYVGGFNPSKNFGFFKEPSHFALLFIPFLLYTTFCLGRYKSVFFLFFSLILAVAIKSLVLVAGVLLISIIFYGLSFRLFLALSFVVIVAVFIEFDHSYFLDRLNFSDTSKNISVLVYLSGWERAVLNVLDSYGMGVGFQQMGYVGRDGEYLNQLYELIGVRLNYNDGGFLLAKLVSEFGVFGIVLIGLYIYAAFRFTRVDLQNYDKIGLFAISLYLAFSVEIFLRGAGYYTPSVFLFFVSVNYFFMIRHRRSSRTVNSRLIKMPHLIKL